MIKKHTKPTVSLGNEKKRSAVSDRPRVKRTKSSKQQTQTIQPPVQLDIKPVIKLEELYDSSIKKEQSQLEPSSISSIKEEMLQNVTLPSRLSSPPPPPPLPTPTPPPSLPQLSTPPQTPPLPSPSSPPSSPSPSLNSPPVTLSPIHLMPPSGTRSELIEKESVETIKFDPCNFSNDILKIKEEILQNEPLKIEPISLTADEIRKAEEGQAAAAMLLEQMSDVEEKYNSPSPPQRLPPSLPSSPSPPPPPENISESKFGPPNYHIKREFHPEDMLTSTVQSINTK